MKVEVLEPNEVEHNDFLRRFLDRERPRSAPPHVQGARPRRRARRRARPRLRPDRRRPVLRRLEGIVHPPEAGVRDRRADRAGQRARCRRRSRCRRSRPGWRDPPSWPRWCSCCPTSRPASTCSRVCSAAAGRARTRTTSSSTGPAAAASVWLGPARQRGVGLARQPSRPPRPPRVRGRRAGGGAGRGGRRRWRRTSCPRQPTTACGWCYGPVRERPGPEFLTGRQTMLGGTDVPPEDLSMSELPKIISVDDHVVEPPHVWETWLPAKYRDRGPAGRAARHRRDAARRRRRLRADLRRRRPAGRLLGLRGPRLHPQAPRRRRRLRPRRHDDVADHLRRDAARAATTRRPASRTWR